MSKSNSFEESLLRLIFNNTPIANIGDASGIQGSATVGQLYLSLHTADPGEAGTQATNEIAYTNYARQGLARTSANFSITGNTMSLNVNVDYPEMPVGGTGGATVTHFSCGVAVSGATVVLYKGTVSPNIVVAEGVTPRLKGVPSGTPSTITED